MSYSNMYLREFAPLFRQILEEKKILPEKLHLEIIDEQPEKESIFETAGVDEVLWQLADELNYLTIYTQRTEHFFSFADRIYKENGLMIQFFSKNDLKKNSSLRQKESKKMQTLVLDFEWDGSCYFFLLAQGKNYIPIYKKPWTMAENLDIIIPFGYNTVIVKNRQNNRKTSITDRFEAAFYAE